jgi:hypothetical protein
MRCDTYVNNEIKESEITLLDREEIISIDHKKRTYSVQTFAQFREQIEKALAKNESGSTTIEPKISLKDPGETRTINGFSARHIVLLCELIMKDEKNKQTGSFEMNMDLWISKEAPGYEEQRQFYREWAQKFDPQQLAKMMSAWGTNSKGFGPSLYREASQIAQKDREKMDGIAVLSITSVNPGGLSTPIAEPSKSSASSGEANKDNVGEALGKGLGEVFGGLGGFGRKKKKKDEATIDAAQEADKAGLSNSASPGLMKITEELQRATPKPR